MIVARCRLSLVAVHALGFVACVGDPPPPLSTADGGPRPSDGAACDLDAPFGAPVLVPVIGSPEDDDVVARLSSDELLIFFGSDRARDRSREPTNDDRDIYIASRTKRTEPFGAPERVAELTTEHAESAPMLTLDGRTLFFESTRPESVRHAIWVATRTETGRFTDFRRLTNLDSPGDERAPFFSPADDALWFGSNMHDPDGKFALYRAKRNGAGFDPPERVPELFTPDAHWHPVLSADGLTIYWASNRADGGAQGDFDVWRARRDTPSSAFGIPENVRELNTPDAELPTWLSPDGCRLYIQRRSATQPSSIYLAEKPPKT